jgi:hypothetical protein
MGPTTISKLPDGRFTVSTKPGWALSAEELREELLRTNRSREIINDLVYRAQLMR